MTAVIPASRSPCQPAFLFHRAPSDVMLTNYEEVFQNHGHFPMISMANQTAPSSSGGAGRPGAAAPTVLSLRFLQTVGMGSPTSVLHRASPAVVKTASMAEIPALCITLVECALQQARQSCPILLAMESDMFLFTTPVGQEMHLVSLGNDLRTRLEQVRLGNIRGAQLRPDTISSLGRVVSSVVIRVLFVRAGVEPWVWVCCGHPAPYRAGQRLAGGGQ